jgi:hypothetical protein
MFLVIQYIGQLKKGRGFLVFVPESAARLDPLTSTQYLPSFAIPSK